MNFYVYRQNFEDPEIHVVDIYVGPTPPNVHVDSGLEMFTGVEELHEFLKSVKATQVQTYQHKLCPTDVMEDLNQWIESNMSLRPVHQSEGSGV